MGADEQHERLAQLINTSKPIQFVLFRIYKVNLIGLLTWWFEK
jgi:hypothetical protein